MWEIKDKNGNILDISRLVEPELEYNGQWMGERKVSVTVKSSTPIAWEIGWYLEYRDEVFTLNYIPTAKKQSSRDTAGDAFVYENVRFSSRGGELNDISFLDVVLNDNNIHFTTLPTFSFFCETIDDFADRIQANTNRYCAENNFAAADYWVIITPVWERVEARILATFPDDSAKFNALKNVARSLFNTYFPDGNEEVETVNINVSISKTKVWDSLSNITDNFEMNFIQKDRSLIIGAAAKINEKELFYGKNNGLAEIERTADENQQVVTKLYAYGSSTNLPPRFYANLNKECNLGSRLGLQPLTPDNVGSYHWKYYTYNSTELVESRVVYVSNILYDDVKNSFLNKENLPVSNIAAHRVILYNGTNTIICHAVRVETYTGGNTGWDWLDEAKNNLAFVFEWVTSDVGLEDFCHIYDGLAQSAAIVQSGIDVDKWPPSASSYGSSAIPDNMAINNLMLPGFPNRSLKAWVLDHDIEDNGVENEDGSVTWRGYTAFFSDEPLTPYILSVNYKDIGVREGTKQWDGSDEEEIYPTIEDQKYNGVAIDRLYSSDIIEDNGVFTEDGEEIDNFNVVVPELGFDLSLMTLSDAAISMKTGYCAARSFNIKNVKQESNGKWKLTLERCQDNDLDIYFPYSVAVASGGTAVADEPYQLRGTSLEITSGVYYEGDQYVFTGILMSQTYIEAAAVRMLEAALQWLSENDFSRSVYKPVIDEIYMAHQHQATSSGAVSTDAALRTKYGNISLHDTLCEGMMLQFSDSDLGITGAVYIESFKIKERGNAQVPTYEITLRDEHEKTVSISGMQKQIESLSGGGGSGSGSGGGTSVSQVKAIGDGRYLRRDQDDETAFNLTAKNLTATENVNAETVNGTTVNGDVVNGDEVNAGEVNVEGDSNLEGTTVLGTDEDFTEGADERVLFKTKDFTDSMTNGNGAALTSKGRMQLRNLEVSGSMTVMELIVNQLRAMAGEYYFSEAGAIRDVDVIDATQKTYKVLLKRSNATELNSFVVGDILFSLANNLSQYSKSDSSFYEHPSWMKVTGIIDSVLTAAKIAEIAQAEGIEATKIADLPMEIIEKYETGFGLTVQLYDDNAVPGGANYAPEAGFNLVRRGNYLAMTYESKKERARVWHLSNTEGMISFLDYLYTPIVGEESYQLTVGKLPNVSTVRAYLDSAASTTPDQEVGVYSKWVFAEQLVELNWLGRVVTRYNPRGEWDDDIAHSTTEPYMVQKVTVNNIVTNWRVDTVEHYNCTWACTQARTTVEPFWGQTDWTLINGDVYYNLILYSSRGSSFRRGYVNTVITPTLMYGAQMDITSLIPLENWAWTRELESGKTEADYGWDERHTGDYMQTINLVLSNTDMPSGWSTSNKVIFTLTATINDGSNEVIITNQVIA